MQEPSSSERIQRIRIGLTGLAFVFLLVLLGTAISRSGEEPVAAPTANLSDNSAEPDDPMAELGIAPGQSEDNASEGAPAGAPAQ